MAESYGPATYGDLIADVYDDWYPERTDAAAEVAFLAQRAGRGPALELGIGTGRVALPLAQTGVDVHGIDASEAMVARLRAKPGGDRIPVTIGDFAEIPDGPACSLVYVVFNTFFGLLTQEAQVACFAGVARRLAPGGAFVMEVFVPDLARFDREQRTNVTRVTPDAVVLDVSRHDRTTQRVDSQHVLLRNDGLRLFPVSVRYAWPAELDLMAQMAGLRLRERVGDWAGAPFGRHSQNHISVYERPAA